MREGPPLPRRGQVGRAGETMTQIMVLAGDGEYGSDKLMEPVAALLERSLDATVSYRTPDVLEDWPTFPESSFGDLATLADTDLLVVYTRFRRLPDAEMKELQRYLDAGGPVVGLRTSNHAFHFPPGSPWVEWNESFGRDVLGSPWTSHHGHTSTTEVTINPGAVGHPVLAGIPEHFRSPSWLYRSTLQPGCTVLLDGDPIDSENEPTPGPVAWVRETRTRRSFYSCLGHPDDFDLPAFGQLVVNAARWCLAG